MSLLLSEIMGRLEATLIGVILAAIVKRRFLLNSLYNSIVRGRKVKYGREVLSTKTFAPVKDEVFVEALEVEGTIPKDLDGLFTRNGPNPYFDPTAGYHIFDGDGMVHACRLKDGTASYCNRFVQTSRLRQEMKAGGPLFTKFGDQLGPRGVVVALLAKLRSMLGVVNERDGNGTANTSLVYHAGRLLALHEGDLPYQLRALCNGIIETVGRWKFGGETKSFTAHPKKDCLTGDLYYLGYHLERPPYAHVGVLSPNGTLLKEIPLQKLPYPSMMHDMCLTQNYVVVLHLPLVFDPKAMFEKPDGMPLVFRKDLPARIGLLPRTNLELFEEENIRWFELPAFMTFHTATAFEVEEEGEGGQRQQVVKIYGSHYDNMVLNASRDDLPEDMSSRFQEYCLNLTTGTASMRTLVNIRGDFPVSHPQKVGQQVRYAWYASNHPKQMVESAGIVKVDLDQVAGAGGGAKQGVQQIVFEENCFGGEAFFVPRHEDPTLCKGEDDGFLLVYIQHQDEDVSYLHIYDAQTMDNTPLARVKLPHLVPSGFHGWYVTDSEMKAQKVE